MMRDRILMAKFSADWFDQDPESDSCICGEEFTVGELVMLHPIEDEEFGPDARQIICLTCHFWYVYSVTEEAGFE